MTKKKDNRKQKKMKSKHSSKIKSNIPSKKKAREADDYRFSSDEDDDVDTQDPLAFGDEDDDYAEPPKWYNKHSYDKFQNDVSEEVDSRALRNEAEFILEEESSAYKELLNSSKKTEVSWMMSVARKGTYKDKIASLVLMVQDSPIHNLSSLHALVNMAKVAKKQQFVAIIDTLTDLFISDLLRPEKDLIPFSKQPLDHLSEITKNDNRTRRELLCYWLFEDKLKELYSLFVDSLNAAAHDTVQANRELAISCMQKLLVANQEEQAKLLGCLINKLGDPLHKVASKVVYSLEKLVNKYPNTKAMVLSEVEKMLFRPHISPRAQYYGICFLSHFRLTSGDKILARDLISLYFSFFKSCVKTGSIDSRLMGALLVGVNRAFPFAGSGEERGSIVPPDQIDTIYKIVHLAPFKISLQALSLLLQISNNDRFYNALYKKLLDAELTHTSHQGIWLHLVLKALKRDENYSRIRAFVKRILQICGTFPAPLACGTLVVLSAIYKKHRQLFANVTLEREPKLPKESVENGNTGVVNMEDDEEDEKYQDAEYEDVENSGLPKHEPLDYKPAPSSWYHRSVLKPKIESTLPEKPKFAEPEEYQPLHRNPAYAGGDYAVFSELCALRRHYHPSVALFADKLCRGQLVYYSGDPLRDFTLIRFLERFSFKNPKKVKDRGEEKQELFRSVGSERHHYNPTGMRALPVQSERYLSQGEKAIPVDELFLYKYLRHRKNTRQAENEENKNSDDGDSDNESVGSVEFDEYLDTLLGKKGADEMDFADDVRRANEAKQKNKKKKKGGEDGSDSNDSEEEEEEEEGEEEDDLYVGDSDLEVDSDFIDSDTEHIEDDDEKVRRNKSKKIAHEDDDDILNEGGEDEDMGEEGDDEDDDEVMDFEDDDSDDDDESMDDDGSSDMESDLDEDDEEKLPLRKVLKRKIGKDFKGAIPAEQFAEILESAGSRKSGGSHDLSNADNAGEKQLKWESNRFNTNHGKNSWKMKKNWKQNNKFGASKDPAKFKDYRGVNKNNNSKRKKWRPKNNIKSKVL